VLLPRLSAVVGATVVVKRDDLLGPPFGGNKVRQLEFYLGEAQQLNADTVIITGAVQSNFVRAAAACAAQLDMACHIQLEERVAGVDATYRNSGNVLLDRLLGATIHNFPEGEDEAGADASLDRLAAELERQGKRPYVIHLGSTHRPLGALGYVLCAEELLDQVTDFDAVIVGSGSGQTHAGLLFGLRLAGWTGRVIGVCVRRPAVLQGPRILSCCRAIAQLLEVECPVGEDDVRVLDHWLWPGYGRLSAAAEEAMRTCARLEGLLLDPVYTAKVMAGLLALVELNELQRDATVVALHSGGLPALFGYADQVNELARE
jgi:D-cysteine desulfhydrase family pyridoxal phosphate-dependent enzyme